VDLLLKVAGPAFTRAHSRGLLAYVRALVVFGQTRFQSLPEIAIVKQANQFGPVHGVEPLQQGALEQIFVSHRFPLGTEFRALYGLLSRNPANSPLQVFWGKSGSDFTHPCQ